MTWFLLFSEYKRLSELDLDTQDKVVELLLSSNTWRKAVLKFNMSSDHIDALQTTRADAGSHVMLFLEATKPDLTVYDFCKVLRESNIQRFDIINELREHLSVPAL